MRKSDLVVKVNSWTGTVLVVWALVGSVVLAVEIVLQLIRILGGSP